MESHNKTQKRKGGRKKGDGLKETYILIAVCVFTLARTEGLEPSPTVLETDMLPITLSSYMATPAGIEPATSGVTGRRDNHLRHGAIMVPSMGLEPIRDCSHQPLKLACLPFHHNGIGDASGA